MFIQDPSGKGPDLRCGGLVQSGPRCLDLSLIDAVQDAHEIGVRHRQPGDMLLDERTAIPCTGGDRGRDEDIEDTTVSHEFMLCLAIQFDS